MTGSESSAIHPVLKSMIEERKILKSILSGEATMDALDGGIAPSAAVAQVASDVTAEDVSFNEFVAIVDELLGNDLPEEAASAFLNGPEFQVYQRGRGSCWIPEHGSKGIRRHRRRGPRRTPERSHRPFHLITGLRDLRDGRTTIQGGLNHGIAR